METIEALDTLIVQFTHTDGSTTFLTFDYEGDEKFAALAGFHNAAEFGSRKEAYEAVALAKFQGLKFLDFTIF